MDVNAERGNGLHTATATVSLMKKTPYWTHHGGEKSHTHHTGNTHNFINQQTQQAGVRDKHTYRTGEVFTYLSYGQPVSNLGLCCSGLFWNCNRKKLKSTSKYIYQTLFLNGENSDIRICALGQEWNLHKVYLCQVSALFCVHYTLY
jgi:hypothetical protein